MNILALTARKRFRPTQFGRLAQRYYPDKKYRTATRLFRHELEATKGLFRALKKAGYTPTSRLLTRTQVRIIEEFIG